MLAEHLHFSRLDDMLRSRAAESYLDQLDPEGLVFTESEAVAATSRVERIVDQVESGDCSGIRALEAEVADRLSALAGLARSRAESGSAGPDGAEAVDAWLATYRKIDPDRAEELVARHFEGIARRFAERDRDDAYSTYLSGLARALDRDSSYLSPRALVDFQTSMKLDLAGIGVAVSERDGVTVVERIIPGGSADRDGGLDVGDWIVAIDRNGEPEFVPGWDLREVVKLLRGRRGSQVVLTVLTPGSEQARRVTMTRREVELDSQRAEVRFLSVDRDGERYKVAILELPSFYSDSAGHESHEDMEDLLRKVRGERADGLIVDLRKNGGGALDAAVRVTGLFIGTGPVVQVKNRTGKKSVLEDRDPRVQATVPMLVLTSRATAAAAEIFTGALKDYGRAIVVGEDRTFGRGTLQRILPMRPGLGAVKLTIGLFYTPGGESPEGNGVASDIVVSQAREAWPSRPFALPEDAIGSVRSALVAETEGFVALDPLVVSELSRRSEKRRAGSESTAVAGRETSLDESVEILADYLVLTGEVASQ